MTVRRVIFAAFCDSVSFKSEFIFIITALSGKKLLSPWKPLAFTTFDWSLPPGMYRLVVRVSGVYLDP